jgi:putative transposase
VAEVPLHIITRGNNCGAYVFADSDHAIRLTLLEQLAAKTGCAVHAYGLMTNHAHMLLTPQTDEQQRSSHGPRVHKMRSVPYPNYR